MKKFLVSVICICFAFTAKTQVPVKPLKIAIFAPVYLDSVFSGEAYKLGKNNLPKYVLPGLDFYNGVMMAVDSLQKEKANIEVLFYDTKAVDTPITAIVGLPEMQDVSLIIASFNSRNEMKPLADFAMEKKIMLLSSTYPNDGGITDNPNFILLNPTLTAHIEALYKFLHRTYPTDNITLFRKKGNTEDMIQAILTNMNKRTPGLPLKLKTVELTDSITTQQVAGYLDSTRRNVVICGTLSEAFGMSFSKALRTAKAYNVIAIGMPTWDGLKDISSGIEIVYTTPYNFTRLDKLSNQLSDKYKLKYAGRASDMVFKGFESMFHFSKLLLKYGDSFAAHLSDKEFKLFNDFDIQPSNTNKEGNITDYLENKKLYIIRKIDGKPKSVN
ncbi:MAG: hypothetical protein V4450_09585 [Bacteroidota bacterium]